MRLNKPKMSLSCRNGLGLMALLWLGLIATSHAAAFEDDWQAIQTDLQRGHIHAALDRLADWQNQSVSPAQQAQLAGALGEAHYLSGQPRHRPEARRWLEFAATADSLAPAMRSRYANLLGNLALAGPDPDPTQAARWYQTALRLAEASPELTASVKLNQVRLLPPADQNTALTTLAGHLASLPETPARARLWLDLGQQARPLNGPAALALAYNALEHARQDAQRQRASRLLSEALGALAQLYAGQGRSADALRLTEAALREAQGAQDHALLWPLETHLAHLLRPSDRPAALQALRRAVRHIEAVREDIPVNYDATGRSSFRAGLARVYLELADWLLQDAPASGEALAAWLSDSRDTVELARQSELEDFLGDRCLVRSRRTGPPALGEDTAVLYPVVLPERLELLLEVRGRFWRFQQAVSAATLDQTAQTLARRLRLAKPDVQVPARQLYEWLIAPLSATLQTAGINTLVIVPDESLRPIPLAALYDGEKFLIERYAVAVSPALNILGQAPPSAPPVGLLLAGLSQAVRGQPELPAVQAEVSELHERFPGALLLNETFTRAQFTRQLADGGHSMVHIASHGQFGVSPEASYVMAYDADWPMPDLETQLQNLAPRAVPLDLLAFSACETAAGNDRLPLGLSGMALRSGARGVLGSLWSVPDAETRQLMSGFYQHRLGAGRGKAEALRRAQQALLANPATRHPFYWAGFILVGDWR